MAYQNPFVTETHIHNELLGLTSLLGIDAKAAAAARLHAVQSEADDVWNANPTAIELEKLQDLRDQNRQRNSELNTLIASEGRRAQDATRAGCYADAKSADSRLQELAAEKSFCSKHDTALANDFEKLQRRAERAYQDEHRRFASKVRQQCESEHATKMAELLELLRGQPGVMALVTDLAIVDALHVAFLP